jgi:hypothetical protein
MVDTEMLSMGRWWRVDTERRRRTKTRADGEAGGRRGPEAWLGSC